MQVSSLDLYKSARVDEVEQAIIAMERNGFALDTKFCEETALVAQDQERATIEALAKHMEALGLQPEDEPNWASPTQVIELVHDKLRMPKSPVWKKGRVKIDKGDVKMDETALEWIIAHAPPEKRGLLVELIRLRRIRGAIKYLTKLPRFVAPDGLVHPVSGPASDDDDRSGTITWRLACKNPEIAQIPRNPKKDWFGIRKAFIAPPGHKLLVADEKALEMVILAHVLIKLFDDHLLGDLLDSGADMHAVNAKAVYGRELKWEVKGIRVDEYPDAAFKEIDELEALREDIKAISYGLNYGKSEYGFATSLRDVDGNPVGEERAKQIVGAYYAALPGLPKYMGWVRNYVLEHHGIVGLGGAWCDLSEFTKSRDEWKIKRACRVAQNYPMQEGGARIVGAAMVDIMNDPLLKEQGLLLERQIHDELDFRFPEGADQDLIKGQVKKWMTAYPLTVKLGVSMGVGDTWAAAK
jgi:DNA polymerase-1